MSLEAKVAVAKGTLRLDVEIKAETGSVVVNVGYRLAPEDPFPAAIDDAEVANCQLTVYEWDDALLISDVRGLPIKSPINFGLSGGNFYARLGYSWQ